MKNTVLALGYNENTLLVHDQILHNSGRETVFLEGDMSPTIFERKNL